MSKKAAEQVAILIGVLTLVACGRSKPPVVEAVPSPEERLQWTADHGSPADSKAAKATLQEIRERPMTSPPEIGEKGDALRLRLGDPDEINRTVTGSQTREQWIYRPKGTRWKGYAYVDNGVVTAFQDSR